MEKIIVNAKEFKKGLATLKTLKAKKNDIDLLNFSLSENQLTVTRYVQSDIDEKTSVSVTFLGAGTLENTDLTITTKDNLKIIIDCTALSAETAIEFSDYELSVNGFNFTKTETDYNAIEFETKDVMDGKTHNIANGSVIYKDNIFEVSTENFIGTLNEDLLLDESVSAVTCNGNSSLSSSDSFRNVRRGLSEIEIIEQVNKILSVGLHEANDSFLEHDWWGSWSDVFILGWVANGDQQTYPENGVLANGILVTNSSGNNNRKWKKNTCSVNLTNTMRCNNI